MEKKMRERGNPGQALGTGEIAETNA